MDDACERGGVVERAGSPCIQTRGGTLFPVLEPVPALIDIDDIACSLSRLCRFNGHSRGFYSVAQHSVLVSRIVAPEHARWGLLHDAPEAFLGDITRPVKAALEAAAPGVLRGIEERLARAVADRFGLPWPMPGAVRAADAVALATERRDLMADNGEVWPGLPEPLAETVRVVGSAYARAEFNRRFIELFGRDAWTG